MKLRLKRVKELFGYAAKLLQEQGPAAMLRRAAGFFARRFFLRRARYLPAKKVLAAQSAEARAAVPAAPDPTSAPAASGQTGRPWPLISVCVPLYNTPPRFLAALLDGMIAQTSPWWQLCLADASDAGREELGRLVAQKAVEAENRLPHQAAPRIVYARIQNKGISANTNAAAALADGEYLALADHDDILAPHAVYTLQKEILATGAAFLYSDEALFKTSIRRPAVGHFKPDYAPEYLLCCNYICHLAAFLRSEFEAVGGERSEVDGAQDHDLFFRLLERIPSQKIRHIPQVLYYWRVHAASTSGGVEAKPYVAAAARAAIAGHLARTGRAGEVADGLFPSTYRVIWPLDAQNEPLVSVLIPNKDHTGDLAACLEGLYKNTDYRNFEVIVIENNSVDPATFAFYDTLPAAYPGCRVERWPGEGFNFSAINNFGRRQAKGEYLLLLNNDVTPIAPGWLGEMVCQAMQPGVAACGALLWYPDDTVQHAGIITGLGGFAGHSHKYHRRGGSGYMFRLATVQDFSAVTAACLLVRAECYDEAGGLDEGYEVAFNDVDFCLRLRQRGWRIVFSPYAELYHHESKSRGLDERDKAKKKRFSREQQRLVARFGHDALTHDPYYNPSLTLDREDFSESADLRGLRGG